MLTGIIFDVDGTLVDSVDAHARAWQEALAHFGFRVRFGDVRAQIGKGADQLMPVFVPDVKLHKPLEEFRGKLFKTKYLPDVKAFPQVRRLIQRLLDDGKRVALASSAKGDELGRYKQLAGIDDLIHTETSSDDADRSKPHPDIFQAALGRLGDPPVDRCVVVGDTPYDVIAARRAQLHTVGVLCGGFPEESLRHEGAVAIYADPASLLASYLDAGDRAFGGNGAAAAHA